MKLELCAFADVYSLVPNIAVCMYIYWPKVNLYQVVVGSNHSRNKFTFDRISGHFRSMCNFIFFWKFLTKWLPEAILDVRNSLSIAFLAISDRSAILDFRNSLSITNSGHFRSIQIYFSILDVWKSLWIAFLAISDWSAILDVRNSLSM